MQGSNSRRVNLVKYYWIYLWVGKIARNGAYYLYRLTIQLYILFLIFKKEILLLTPYIKYKQKVRYKRRLILNNIIDRKVYTPDPHFTDQSRMYVHVNKTFRMS